MMDAGETGTRKALLAAARRHFSERGLHGTSLQRIAADLGLTKQALIHHFGTKERLYAEVLAGIAGGLADSGAAAASRAGDPPSRLEARMLGLWDALSARPEETRLLIRELMDLGAGPERARNWPLKGFLDSLVVLVRETPGGRGLPDTEVLARLYLVFGAISCFAVSQAALTAMYGKAGFASARRQVPGEVRRILAGFRAP